MRKAAFIALLLFSAGCSSSLDKKLVEVGSSAIYQSDLDRQLEIDRLLGKTRDTRSVIAEMAKDAVNVEILKANGSGISVSQVLNDKEKVFRLSQDNPQKVAELVKALGPDVFAKNYAIPLLARHAIFFDFYMKKKETHMDSFFRARKFRHSIKQHRLKSHAHMAGYPVYYVRVDRDNIVTWTREWSPKDLRVGRSKKKRELAKRGTPDEAVEWKGRIPDLPIGRISPKIFDLGTSWALVKRKAKLKREDYYYAETVLIPKKPFSEWIKPYKKKVAVKFNLGV